MLSSLWWILPVGMGSAAASVLLEPVSSTAFPMVVAGLSDLLTIEVS